jgi:hypothetical protein
MLSVFSDVDFSHVIGHWEHVNVKASFSLQGKFFLFSKMKLLRELNNSIAFNNGALHFCIDLKISFSL